MVSSNLQFIPDPTYYVESKDCVLWLDTSKIDKLLEQEDPFYIRLNGGIRSQDKYNNISRLVGTGTPLKMPHLAYDQRLKIIGLLDGRHRFAFLRDNGIDKIPFTMDRNTARVLKSKLN